MIQLLDLIYPPICGICGKICKESLCSKCKIKLKKYEINYNKNFENSKIYFFDEVFSIFKYEEIIRDTIIKYKFHNKPYLYKTFSKIILNDKKTCAFLKKYDIIIPVPIHKNRKNKRGYNQTELIARDIAKELNLKFENNILIKTINNKAQSELTKKERANNIKNAFEILNTKNAKDKNMLIFDDIYTTGSTTNECARLIKQFTTKKVGILTIAKDYKK